VNQINKDDFTAITTFIQEVRKGEQGFFQKFDQILQEAASQSFSLDIAAAYDRSDETAALIDVDIRLQNDDAARTPNAKGQNFMRAAGRGDFSDILANYDPSVVRLRQGSLTHKLSTSQGLTVNIAGWHNSFLYSDMYKVVVNSEQQIRSTPSGMLNVFTTVDLSTEHDKKRKTTRHEQEMHSTFTLRFLAQTNTTVTDSKFNQRDKNYLLDVITGQSATYSTTLSDSNTTQQQLDHLLAFAKSLGLDRKGATQDALKPILKLENGRYGPVNADYRVRFSEQGLASLFKPGSPPVTEDDIREILRRIVVANYAGDVGLAPVAWLYCSDRVRELALGNPNFFDTEGVLEDAIANGEVQIEIPFPGMEPVLQPRDKIRRELAGTLFRIEKTLIDSFLQLQDVVKKESIKLKDLENAVQGFGKALNDFESQTELSQTTSPPTFAVFDGLIQLATPAAQARDSALALKVGPQTAERQLLFQLVSETAALGAGVGSTG
jgi:hypothetical protein